MPWDQRGYYARVYRVGRKVMRQYFGRGSRAEAAAAEDDQRRAELRRLREELNGDLQRWREAIGGLEDLIVQAETLYESALIAGGYHQHAAGEWRRWLALSPPTASKNEDPSS